MALLQHIVFKKSTLHHGEVQTSLKAAHSFRSLILKEIGRCSGPFLQMTAQDHISTSQEAENGFSSTILRHGSSASRCPLFSDPSICYHPPPPHRGRCLLSRSPSILITIFLPHLTHRSLSIIPAAYSCLPLACPVTLFSLDLSLSSESPL